ncbi:MAG: site-specific DNA-methyltransferase [Chloroflexi bacterium]|nr:site-specific DNA-methyltransferase [Chloroflexota bacterium]
MNNKQQSTENSEQKTMRLEQADCLDFLRSLPDDSVDVMAMDPAYSGMNERLKLGNGRIVGQYKQKGSKDAKWFREFQDSEANYRQFLEQCRRVLNPETGHIYIMFDSYSLLSLGPLMRDYFAVKNLITWDKINIGMGHYFRRRHEYVIFATNGNNRKLRHQAMPDVWRFKRIHRAQYATQKPVELFQAMIFASAEPGFTVCDPFMGSGSSAIAALKNGCHFWGCDVAETAVALAQNRIAAYQKTGQDTLQSKPASLPDEKVFWE